jgi:2-polyprenyl-3-methyl-5-hydroxy-6-metoxy-1,4-benzoquinol methylase
MTTMNPLLTPWPAQDLEPVAACPYCGSDQRMLAHADVQDWSFGSAPGTWSYWSCQACQALYLHPRPTVQSIGAAYSRYYTHASGPGNRWVDGIKQRLKNECWSQAFGAEHAVDICPRWGLPRWMGGLLKPLQSRITAPFGLAQLATLPRGVLLDVGCGNGATLQLGRQLGWQPMGIELDAAAVQTARAQGLQVEQGSYEALAQYAGLADCLVCSHVIEHVHDPLHLLRLLVAALKPGGVLLLSAPNATSYLRTHYGDNWRGLEAPRHVAIPAAQWLIQWLQAAGLQCVQEASYDGPMATESERIARRSLVTLATDATQGLAAMRAHATAEMARQDMVQLVCTMPAKGTKGTA